MKRPLKIRVGKYLGQTINYITSLGGRGQGLCNKSILLSLDKSHTSKGGKKYYATIQIIRGT